MIAEGVFILRHATASIAQAEYCTKLPGIVDKVNVSIDPVVKDIMTAVIIPNSRFTMAPARKSFAEVLNIDTLDLSPSKFNAL